MAVNFLDELNHEYTRRIITISKDIAQWETENIGWNILWTTSEFLNIKFRENIEVPDPNLDIKLGIVIQHPIYLPVDINSPNSSYSLTYLKSIIEPMINIFSTNKILTEVHYFLEKDATDNIDNELQDDKTKWIKATITEEEQPDTIIWIQSFFIGGEHLPKTITFDNIYLIEFNSKVHLELARLIDNDSLIIVPDTPINTGRIQVDKTSLIDNKTIIIDEDGKISVKTVPPEELEFDEIYLKKKENKVSFDIDRLIDNKTILKNEDGRIYAIEQELPKELEILITFVRDHYDDFKRLVEYLGGLKYTYKFTCNPWNFDKDKLTYYSQWAMAILNRYIKVNCTKPPILDCVIIKIIDWLLCCPRLPCDSGTILPVEVKNEIDKIINTCNIYCQERCIC